MSSLKKTWNKVRGKKSKRKQSAGPEKELAADAAHGRKGKRLSAALHSALAASDDWQAVGQRRRDLIEGQKRFNESELAAGLRRRARLDELNETPALMKTRPYRRNSTGLTGSLRSSSYYK